MINQTTALAFALVGLSILGCTHPHGVTFDSSGASLTVHKPALYPETIEYNPKHDQFLLSSFREGAVYEVDRSGNATLLVDDPRLCSVLGIAVDAKRGRLWAVNSDLGASIKPSAAGPKQLAGVGVYDLSTGKPLTYIDLAPLAPGPHLLNGIAVDSAGNGYITDSFSPIIYKVDARGNATVFLKDAQFAGEGINLNGVAVHPDGYLLAIKKSDGVLFKVPLAHPAQFSKVAISERFAGGDGITLIGNKDLVLIANRTPTTTPNAAYSLTSEDAWASAKLSTVQPLGDVYPTTAVLRDNTLYVLHSKLNELIQSSAAQKGQLRMEATIRPIARVGR
jgi:DNA-binding beta-propeller fold protein YncE